MIEKKEFTVKEQAGFRIRVEYWPCLRPGELYAINFVQESLDEDAIVKDTSTYNFFMTVEEINKLSDELKNICNGS